MNPISPSAYVSRLRRAFLLNAHPDRFGSHSSKIRLDQGKLLQAIGERMAATDFVAYSANEPCTSDFSHHSFKLLNYVLERRDGSLARHTIDLNATAENVLASMRKALEESAIVKLPPPPPKKATGAKEEWTDFNGNRPKSGRAAMEFDRIQGIIMAAAQQQKSSSLRRQVNHRFDVNSARGKDLAGFLEFCWDATLVEQCRSQRMDATVAALVARRAYKFSAIDGTNLKWSSSSLQKCLQSLTSLWHEHHDKFHVKSFYPLRLELTSSELSEHLDVYSGVLRLNPACTKLQWLETLQLVTGQQLETLKCNQDILKNATVEVQHALGVKIKRGHSCRPREYHYFVTSLAASTQESHQECVSSSSSALSLERPLVTVETSSACRRPKVTRGGSIRLGSQMSAEIVHEAISRLSDKARRHKEQQATKRQECRGLMNQAQWQLGLNKVYQVGNTVTTQQVADSILRLLSAETAVRELMKNRLAGNSLGIAGSGQFCHLGDDGSLVIPWDWR